MKYIDVLGVLPDGWVTPDWNAAEAAPTADEAAYQKAYRFGPGGTYFGLDVLGANAAAKESTVASAAISAVSLAGLGTTIYLLAKARWGWALGTFFLFTPAAATGVAIAAVLLTRGTQGERQ